LVKVAIVAGSRSDGELVNTAKETLDKFGIESDIHYISAHRNPDKCRDFALNAKKNGYSIIIAIAGLAAHLPGVIASMTDLPVIGVPVEVGALKGLDALLSIMQMPGSTPVGTMAIGKAGAKNAAIFSARILALSDLKIAKKVAEYRKKLEEGKG